MEISGKYISALANLHWHFYKQEFCAKSAMIGGEAPYSVGPYSSIIRHICILQS
jgi:hypothetical protein